MVMWSKEYDPYVTVHVPNSSAFLPIVLDIPGNTPMIHIALYLPTAGKENDFLTELANLRISIEHLQSIYPKAAVFLCSDCNASRTNKKRNSIFSNFCADLNFTRVELLHNSYHHFLGKGASDSELDVILYSGHDVHEELLTIVCKHDNPLVDSHHDLLLSVSSTPPITHRPASDKSKNVSAPKLVNERHRIVWTDESVKAYESLVSSYLPRLTEQWLDTSSETSMTILLEATNMVLSQAALTVCKSLPVTMKSSPKSAKIPASIRRSNAALARTAKKLRIQSQDTRFSSIIVEQTRERFKSMKADHRRLVRRKRMADNNKRDSETFSVLTENCKNFYQSVRKSKRSTTVKIQKLQVGDRLYEGDDVCDGFYDSISFLKTKAHTDLESSEFYNSANKDYERILNICQKGSRVPRISLEQTKKILDSIRPAVSDFSSITGYHYRYAGTAGLRHLNELLNALIEDINNLAIPELNITSACILHKGHGKLKTLAESYRTISTCPFLSKALDSYIGELYGPVWDQHQASTQYQGKGSSHELAALLLTETIQHSLFSSKKPIFALYLDAMSAFDLVLRQFLINNLYHNSVQSQGLLLIDQRLKNRRTICEWDGQLMGPICDTWGLEQGGKNSSDFYKVYNNIQLDVAQDSELGVDLGGSDHVVVSAIGQADDVVLVSNDIFALQNLLQLSLQYCKEHHVSLRADKTKLQVYSNKASFAPAYYAKAISPIIIDGHPVKFDEVVEHVGLLRSTSGNMAHILNRFTAHKRSLEAVLPVGHRGNPAASIHVHQLYAAPVLFSCIPSLALNKSEIEMIDHYLKVSLQNLQKLMNKTPACVVAFLGGSLPGTALLHLKQLTTFGMVARMPGSVLHTHGNNVLVSAMSSASSWFLQI